MQQINVNFFFRLIRHLIATAEHRKEMVSISKRQNTYNIRMEKQVKQQTNQVTKLLIFVLITFIIGELPHGICIFLNAYYGPKFFWAYYYYAMEIFNSITHISECFNLVIYYSMSPQFGKVSKALFISSSKTIFHSLKSSQKSDSSLPIT